MATVGWSNALERLRVVGREGSLTLKALRTSKLSMVGLILLLVFVAIALLAPVISLQHPTYVDVNGVMQQRWPTDTSIALLPPSLAHPFGTDELGVDLWS